jgi:acetylornithine deacetylase/succinyl-diaminopimelate desuccinylase-like protein
VPDAGLAARLKDPATARAAGAELRATDPVVAGLVEPLFGATLTPTVLDAGKAVNVIPTRAEACIDCRILPEMTHGDVRDHVATVLDPLGIEWEFEWVDVTTPNASRPDSPFRDSIERVLRRDVPGAVLAPMTSGSFTDSRWVREAFPDCVAYGFAPFPVESFHAMDGGRDHEPDERILVEDVVYQALFFERLVRDLLT